MGKNKSIAQTLVAQTYEDVEQLDVVKAGKIHVKSIQAFLFQQFPNELTMWWVIQLLDSTESSIANIAEAYGIATPLKRVNFLRISRGSMFESIMHLQLAPIDVPESYISEWKALLAMLDCLIKKECIESF